MNKEVLYSNEELSVIQKDGRIGVEPVKLEVVVMPYTAAPNGLPVAIGVIDEPNPFRDGGRSITLITGQSNDEDPDILSAAQRKLKEDSGLDVLDPDRWSFLGFMTVSKNLSDSYPCFACNITGLDVADGTKFKLMAAKDALDTDDCFVPTLFMKMFRYVFNLNGNTQVENKTTAKQSIPDDIKNKVLKVAGVAGVGTNADGANIVHLNAEYTDEVKKQLDGIFGDIKYVVEKN